MVLLMLAPLLLLGGRPVILALRALPRSARPKLARLLARARPWTGPLPCLGVFYAVVLLTHLPGFYGATLRNPALHEAEHATYLLAGLLLWWPILDGDPAPAHRLGGLGAARLCAGGDAADGDRGRVPESPCHAGLSRLRRSGQGRWASRL